MMWVLRRDWYPRNDRDDHPLHNVEWDSRTNTDKTDEDDDGHIFVWRRLYAVGYNATLGYLDVWSLERLPPLPPCPSFALPTTRTALISPSTLYLPNLRALFSSYGPHHPTHSRIMTPSKEESEGKDVRIPFTSR
eukprot:scaffold54095_cov51-Cyclotella_meneghiniana.AAC.1